MTRYAAFRRQPVEQPYALALQTITLPAPTRGIVQSENEAYMGAGGAIVQDNWAPTMRGVKLRGGSIRWSDLHALDATVPPVPSPLRLPVISAFEYQSGNTAKMFAANLTKLFDVTVNGAPTLVKSGQTSGNYAAAQMANAAVSALGTNWMMVCNESGDYPLRYNGSTWVTLDGTVPGVATDGASKITGPAGSAVEFGHGLSYVWKYRSRLYFIEAGSMNAWYLSIDAVGGVLTKIPLAGSATKGGRLLWGATWSLDAGDGIDEKCIFATDQGELLIFTGTNPADPANWRQEGRYTLSPSLGMNAHIQVGGDMLVLAVDGIIPVSQAITKDAGQLELAVLTRLIKPLWRDTVTAKRSSPWTVKKWDEYGGLFIATPGGAPASRYCFVANNVTGAWCRFTWDSTCFIRMAADMFFGTQDGLIMQADRTGYDDGVPYVATLVGGWEMFGASANEVVWLQARASFHSASGEPFAPQLSATTDYVVTLPPAPPPGPDPGVQDVWDQGKWGPPGSGGVVPPPGSEIAAYAQWDQPAVSIAPVRNTMWVSIGMTGFAHAPIVQVTMAQQAKPNVELIAISATYNVAGVNV